VTTPAERRVELREIVAERGLFVDELEERSTRIAAEAERAAFEQQRRDAA
jgi:hypothetical protein